MAGEKRSRNPANIARDIGDIKYAIRLFVDEAREDRKQAAEDRKQAAEDRKDIKLYFSKILEEIHLDRINAQKDRRTIAAILRSFSSTQNSILGMQKEGNKKLGNIERYLRVRGNGNSNGKSSK